MTMTHEGFVILIPSHGRAAAVDTVRTILHDGYTGDWRIVVDDEDVQGPDYVERFGEERVIVFSKADYAAVTDVGDNFPGRQAVVFARNACFDIARSLGCTYALVLDDDYGGFYLRYEDGPDVLNHHRVWDFDAVCDLMLDLLDDTKASAVAIGQGGDYIGGIHSGTWRRRFSRKAMNTWFIRTDRPFAFAGRINEDTNVYTLLGTRGHLFLTLLYCQVNQIMTQQQRGGLTETYLELGTYVKSFYSVMMCPSAVFVNMLVGKAHSRIHHQVRWRYCVPKIVPETFRKPIAE